MDIPTFALERWLSENKIHCTHDLSGCSAPSIQLRDLMGVQGISPETRLSYGPTIGSTELRRSIAEWYSGINEENILVTTGAAEANFLVMNALLTKDDTIIVQMPSYMQVYGLAQAIGARIEEIHLKEDSEQYRMDISGLKDVSSRPRIMQFTNPNNPTGFKFTSQEVRAICEIAEDSDSYVMFDEAFRGMELDGSISPAPPQIYEKGISTGSLTKLGLHGLRIGWIIAEKSIISKCWSYKDYTTLSHSGLSEKLAIEALKSQTITMLMKRARTIISEHSRIISQWCREHSQFTCVPPQGGGAAFPRYSLDLSSIEFCKKFLDQERVLLVPGDYFDAPKHFRLNCGGFTEVLRQGLDKLGNFVRNKDHP